MNHSCMGIIPLMAVSEVSMEVTTVDTVLEVTMVDTALEVTMVDTALEVTSVDTASTRQCS